MQTQKTKSVVLTGKGWDLRPSYKEMISAMEQDVSTSDTEYYDDTVRWPIWKTGLLVVGLCGGFWICAVAIMLSVLG